MTYIDIFVVSRVRIIITNRTINSNSYVAVRSRKCQMKTFRKKLFCVQILYFIIKINDYTYVYI